MLYASLNRLLLIAGVLALPLGVFAAAPKSDESGEGLLPLEDLRMFTRVYDHIRSGYVEEISDSKLLEYAIKGMLSELDPHSAYLDKKAFEDLQVNTTGEFGGVGIEIGQENGFIKVISPIDGTPAQKAGIETGDLIIRLDDKPVKSMSLNEAIQMMRGPKGSELILTIMRSGVEKPFDVVILRDTIKVQSVRTRIMDDDFLYIRIAQFQIDSGRDTARRVREQLEKTPNLKGIILDLRNNPGGVLQASVEVVDAFLDTGLVVYTEGRLENSDINYTASSGDASNGLPIVVLINEGSASASEIVAGALQDHKRAVIMGTRSFGKGSVQTVIPISESRAIKLTTALYYTPGGRSIQAQGIEPDVIVERAEVTALKAAGPVPTEADLAGHLQNKKGGEEVGSKSREQTRTVSIADPSRKDNQLQEALNLLKGLHIFRKQQEGGDAKPLQTAEVKRDAGDILPEELPESLD
ncbi:S41 family peptidase [Cellvibrio polysaccharolyticus]|uniref:S41 family peptidase n=1 Tax=Cellvibrio polysaccharolyticus TaxID=2082724 RepID=A0A928V709_9GAMM|nr:S41 family peptidase [Cellvibrio polysaccharolyticus]MBE8719073.1 S41 family peptidase [Cellvibrio polysaccharolyticus]